MRRLFIAMIVIVWALPAAAANRLALVIGNDSYAHVSPLQKARGDARAVSDALGQVGFDVDMVLDATRRDMNLAITGFTARLQPGDTALVFYAGHGVEIDGENYLLPLDIEAPDASGADFVKFESVALSDLMNRVQATGARTTLMFLDACRDNPFEASNGRSIGGSRGLARVSAPEGSFVVFSAGARQQALDRLDPGDTNQNSVFTRLLLPRLTQPDLELRDLIGGLRVEVRDLALSRNHAQFPAYYDELLGDFYFASNRGLAPEPEASPGAAGGDVPARPVPTSDIRADFELARSLGTKAAWQAFLDTYAGRDDLAVELARSALAALDAEPPAPNAQPARAPEVVTVPAPLTPSEPDPRELIRATQTALNKLGCAAGGADGVAGNRTRTAFAEYIKHAKSGLRPADLGTQAALNEINSRSGRICPIATAATPAPAANPGWSLAGTWYFSASCPLFIKSTGSVRIRKTGTNSYAMTTTDSLGHTSQGTVTVSGEVLNSRQSWSNGVQTTEVSRISADRRSYSGRSSLGCTFTARKAG